MVHVWRDGGREWQGEVCEWHHGRRGALLVPVEARAAPRSPRAPTCLLRPPCAPRRQYEQDSHDTLTKTIAEQTLLPQARATGTGEWVGRATPAGLFPVRTQRPWRPRIAERARTWLADLPARPPATLGLQEVFTMLLKKIYKRQK